MTLGFIDLHTFFKHTSAPPDINHITCVMELARAIGSSSGNFNLQNSTEDVTLVIHSNLHYWIAFPSSCQYSPSLDVCTICMCVCVCYSIKYIHMYVVLFLILVPY